MSEHEAHADHDHSEGNASHDAAQAASWLARGGLLALAGFGLLVVIMIIANAKEPYGGPLEA